MPADHDLKSYLDKVYSACGNLERLDRDPLAVVRRYSSPTDREVAGLICACLAFGSVDLIIRACGEALAPLGSHPASALDELLGCDSLCADGSAEARFRGIWGSFRYRYCGPDDLISLFMAIARARRDHGSLRELFLAGDIGASADSPDLAGSLSSFVRALRGYGILQSGTSIRPSLLPDPADGSACKRLFLYLRWMVRRDEVDPGDWPGIDPARLLVPLDTHMLQLCRGPLGFLPPGRGARPASPSLSDARRVTACFARYAPGDPVKYDFALTRLGIDPKPGDPPANFPGCAAP